MTSCDELWTEHIHTDQNYDIWNKLSTVTELVLQKSNIEFEQECLVDMLMITKGNATQWSLIKNNLLYTIIYLVWTVVPY